MSIFTSGNLNHLWVSLIVEELIRNGVENFCIAPGSRSTPLTVQVASNKKARSFVHFDERGLGYYALGLASATGKPCAVITTSGTAAANLFPAIIEASKKKLPLIIITADRPPELRHTGAHQTIDQTKLYGDHVRFFLDFPTPTTSIDSEFVLTSVDLAVSRSQGELKGPVHLNCMFREPLEPTGAKEFTESYLTSISAWRKSGKPYTTYLRPKAILKDNDLQGLNEAVSDIRSGLIVVGKISGDKNRDDIIKLADKLNWPIFADITSGLRLGKDLGNVITHFDQLLLSKKVQELLKFDGILHLGGRITSKRYYQLVERLKPQNYIMVLDHPLRNDPLHNVSLRVHAPVGEVIRKLNTSLPPRKESALVNKLLEADTTATATIQNTLKNEPALTEFAAASIVSQCIGQDNALFLASSLPIREMDMFAQGAYANVPVGSNRGASGIDGTIASACGYSQGLNKPVTLLIGDLAFLYDINSLSILNTLKKPMTIVLLNNDGGGIFSFLPIAQQKGMFERFFGTPHGLTFKHSALQFGLNYEQPQTNEEFIQAYSKSLNSSRSTLIEVITSRDKNVELQRKMEREINKVIK